MKKLFLIAILFAFSIAGIAQSSSIGLQVGANLASATIKEASISLSPDSKFGFLAGAVIDVPLSTSISFRPELNFIQKGFELKSSSSFGGFTYSSEDKVTLNFVELPLNFVYNITAGDHRVFVGAGPTFAYGVSGKSKSKSTATGQPTIEEEADINFGGDEMQDDLKAFDLGANVLAGFKMNNGMFFRAAYGLGFSNLSHHSDDSFKNKGFSFTIGFMFKKGENFSKDY